MSTLPRLSGPGRPPAAPGPARQLVILLHGYGADGNDLIGLAPHLAEVLPHAAFVSPHGPEPCDASPMGRQWFSLRDYDPNLMRRDPRYTAEMKERMRQGSVGAAPILDAFVEEELSRTGLDDSGLALIGFSQGTMMALQVALRRARPCAAVVGFSGSLVGADRLPAEVTARPPVLLVHGDADELVPVEALYEAVSGLGAAEVSVEWHVSRGTGHGIAPDGLELASRFLAQAFGGERVKS